jgi:putative protease
MPYRLYANPEPQGEGYREHEGEFSLQRTDRPELPPIALDEDTWGTYFMSSRDICAIDVIPDLMAAGLDSFKIEGRTKSVYYLSQVVRAYRLAIDSCAACAAAGAPVRVSEESLRAISFVDGRGFMPGFMRGPLPQNYESTHQEAPGGCVAAQVLDYDASMHAFRVNVKNRFSMDDSLELMTPSGQFPCEIGAMKDFKGGSVDTLHPGTEGWVFLQKPVEIDTENIKFFFFIRKMG